MNRLGKKPPTLNVRLMNILCMRLLHNFQDTQSNHGDHRERTKNSESTGNR